MSRALVSSLVLLCALATSARATWSIIIGDPSTGEIAIGSATCLTNFNLQSALPVMVVGKGAGAAQSAIDNTGSNRKEIFEELMAGTSATDIIPILKAGDPFVNSRQYGVVDLFTPDAAGFTGTSAGAFADDITGTDGNLIWAIQGNVITGSPVLEMAENAILATPGPLSEKLMAAMEAARLMGGDGRCSCLTGPPSSCGSPPPSFEKSAHIGFMIVARLGDVDGFCAASGCATGDYWMTLNVPNQTQEDPDPVLQLQDLYDAFKLGLAGRPDALVSSATLTRNVVAGTGKGNVFIDVVLSDFDGGAVGPGPYTLSVAHAPDSAGLAAIQTITDLGNGAFEVKLRVGEGEGVDRFEIVADDGVRPVTLAPFPTLEHRPPLAADLAQISAAGGGLIGLELTGPVGAESQDYFTLMSFSGTAPGFPLFHGLTIPLNDDAAFFFSAFNPNVPPLVDSAGTLDAEALGAAGFDAPATGLALLVGFDLSFAWVTRNPVDFASNPVSVSVVP